MTTSTFRQTVAAVAARAKERLPEAVNGRVELAVKLVLGHDVEVQADGSILVGSSSDPMKQYRLEGHTCPCQDFAHGKGIEGWCQHRIAAGIDKRVRELLPVAPPVEPWADNDFEDPEPEAAQGPCDPTPPAPASLPEAAFSLTLKGTLDGVEALLTARGQTADEFTRNLQAIRGLLDVPQPLRASSTHEAPPASPGEGQPLSPQQHNALAMHRPITPPSGWCAVHNVAMPQNEKNGQRWFSHRLPEGGFCKGR